MPVFLTGPTMLASGVALGLVFPALADLARPLMPVTIFLIVLGTLLRVDPAAVMSTLRRPAFAVAVPAAVMIGCPLLAALAARAAGFDAELGLALMLALSAPPSSGTAAVARMLGLDGAVPLAVTVLCMALAPVTIPLLAGWLGGVAFDPLDLAWRLALLIGGAEGIALVVRRRAAAALAAHGRLVDAAVVAALLVFALGTMAGIRDQALRDPIPALACLALAFAVNAGLQATGALMLAGTLAERLTVGLIFGNRNIGLVWSALGAAATPRLALYFAAAQLPIYMLPRLLEILLTGRKRSQCP